MNRCQPMPSEKPSAMSSAMPSEGIRSPRFGRAAGFSLTESLIAMTLFAIGFLALAGLQLTGMRSTMEGHQRSLAQLLVQQMADRIRTNRLLILKGDRDSYTVDPNTLDEADVKQCHEGGGCNGTEIASYDLLQWRLAYTALLPGARGRVCYDDGIITNDLANFAQCGDGSILTIHLAWTTRGTTEAEDGQHYIVSPISAL